MDLTAPKPAVSEVTTPKRGTEPTAPKPTVTDPDDPWCYNNDISLEDVPLALLPRLLDFVNSDDAGKQGQGAMLLCKIVYVAARCEDDQEGNPLDTVMASGVVPRLIQLLESPSDTVCKQAACCVGNIAGVNHLTRDFVIAEGAMEPLLQCASSSTLSVARNGVWAVSTLCRGKPSPKLDAVAVALPVLVPLLARPDEDVVTDACWAISYISDGSAERVEPILTAGALPQIINLLSSNVDSHVTPAVRTVGNVVQGTTEQVQQLLSNGVLPFFHDLLRHPRRAIKKEACRTLSNIIAKSNEMIQAVIDTELFPPIVKCMHVEENEVKKEALWCIANVTTEGTPAQIRYLVEDLSVFRHLVELLGLPDANIVSTTLDTVDNILEAGCRGDLDENPYAKAFENCGGLERLRSLSDHANYDVSDHAAAMSEGYFSKDGAEDAG